jgi:L-lactate dehydrogenase complex protein LldE
MTAFFCSAGILPTRLNWFQELRENSNRWTFSAVRVQSANTRRSAQPLFAVRLRGFNFSPMRIALFIPCFVDQLLPEVGLDMVRVLRRLRYDVDFPQEQTCCGQPAFNSGYWDDAKPLAERFVGIFSSAEIIVCPSGSCTTMVRNFYPQLLKDSPLRDKAIEVGRRVFEFSEFLIRVAKVSDVGASFPHRVTYHDACHALRELGIKRAPRDLLRQVRGLELIEMPYSEDCCGFGGTFATKFAMISGAMGDTKAGNAEKSGAEYVTSTDPSCLLHLDGILRKQNSKVRTIYLASILAQTSAGAGVTAPDAKANQEPVKR